MKTTIAITLRAAVGQLSAAVSFVLLLVVLTGVGCAPAADCPVCGTDNTLCDTIDFDTAEVAIDTTGGPDIPGDNDISGNTDVGTEEVATDASDDADVDDVASDASDDAETDTFFTGTGRIYGSAHFINMDDHSGFEVKLYHSPDISDQREQPVLATFITRQNGVYAFNNLPEGLYKVSISHGPLTLEGSRGWGPTKINEGKTEYIMSLGFTAVGAIDGTVVFKDYWGEMDLTRTAIFKPGRSKLTHPDIDGRFSIDRLLPGQYEFCVGASNLTGKCFNPVTIEGLKVTSLGTVELTPWDQVTRPGVDVSGIIKLFGMTDHSGIEVIYDAGPDQVVTTSDADGNYAFTNVRPGNVELKFNAPEGSGFERDSATNFYEFYAGTSDVLPVEYLVRGYAIWKDDWTYEHSPVAPMFSPDSKNILYTWSECGPYDLNCPYENQLLSIDIASQTTTRVTDSVGAFVMSPDSSTVVFTHQADDNLLFSVPIDGGIKRFITAYKYEFHGFSPDSRFALYSNFSLYDIDDPDYVLINPAWAYEVDTGSQHELCEEEYLSVTADSRFVFCRTRPQTLKVVELEDGSPVYQTELSGRYILGQDQRTLFVCNVDGSAKFVDLETGTETPVADEFDDCSKTLLMPSMNAVIYHSASGRLMAAPVDGGTPIILADGDAYPLLATPDSTRVIYGIKVENQRATDIYVADVSGISMPTLLISGLYGLPETFIGQENGRNQKLLVDRNSDTVFVSMSFSDSPSELRRFSLDGSDFLSFGLLCDNNCDSTRPLWRVDETGGFVYTYTPAEHLQTQDIATGQVIYQSSNELGFGDVASDMSGSVLTGGNTDALLWQSFPELTTTPIAPWGENYTTSYAISPDNSMLMFNSDFGFETNPPEYRLNHRLMIAPLK